jgi:hypothetical protein
MFLLVLCNRKEAHLSLKEQNPEKLIGFSNFAEIRLKSCALAEVGGMHPICVCSIHQNVKFMISGAKLCDLTEKQVKTYEDCTKLFVMCQV